LASPVVDRPSPPRSQRRLRLLNRRLAAKLLRLPKLLRLKLLRLKLLRLKLLRLPKECNQRQKELTAVGLIRKKRRVAS
jgi:hypothetical protein